MAKTNAIETAKSAGLSAQQLVRLAPEYRGLLMEGVRNLWSAEQDVTDAQIVLGSVTSQLRDAERALFWAKARRDRIRRDISALVPELEAIQEIESGPTE